MSALNYDEFETWFALNLFQERGYHILLEEVKFLIVFVKKVLLLRGLDIVRRDQR